MQLIFTKCGPKIKNLDRPLNVWVEKKAMTTYFAVNLFHPHFHLVCLVETSDYKALEQQYAKVCFFTHKKDIKLVTLGARNVLMD